MATRRQEGTRPGFGDIGLLNSSDVSSFQSAAVQRGAHEAGLDAQLQPDRVDIEICAAMSSLVKYNHCGQQFPEDDQQRGVVFVCSACK